MDDRKSAWCYKGAEKVSKILDTCSARALHQTFPTGEGKVAKFLEIIKFQASLSLKRAFRAWCRISEDIDGFVPLFILTTSHKFRT